MSLGTESTYFQAGPRLVDITDNFTTLAQKAGGSYHEDSVIYGDGVTYDQPNLLYKAVYDIMSGEEDPSFDELLIVATSFEQALKKFNNSFYPASLVELSLEDDEHTILI
jgi:hypothetical protein